MLYLGGNISEWTTGGTEICEASTSRSECMEKREGSNDG